MRKYNVLVTGIGAIIGYGIISSLKKSKYDCNIIGMDIYIEAAGQVWCDKFIQSILAADEKYVDFLIKIIKENNIDLVFFGTEQEIKKCYDNKEKLGDYYSKLVINSDYLIKLADDKWSTNEFLVKNNFDYIPSSIDYDFHKAYQEFGLPLLLKPRRSYASKGIIAVETEKEFTSWRNEQGEQFMVQKLVGDKDHEYTASVFGFGDGTSTKPIIMRRKLSRFGATDYAEVQNNEKITNEITDLVKALKPVGPTNFQFRLDSGRYLLLEVNPRISSSTSIRTAFGYNEAEMCIEYFLEGRKPENRKIKLGRAFRYITEAIEYYDSNNI